MVVRPYSVVARQCVSDAWVPPERTALDGRRTLYGENWVNLSPSGLLGRGLGRGRTFASYGENGARFAWVPLWEGAAGLLLAQKPGTCVGGTGRRRGWCSISSSGGGGGSSQVSKTRLGFGVVSKGCRGGGRVVGSRKQPWW